MEGLPCSYRFLAFIGLVDQAQGASLTSEEDKLEGRAHVRPTRPSAVQEKGDPYQ